MDQNSSQRGGILESIVIWVQLGRIVIFKVTFGGTTIDGRYLSNGMMTLEYLHIY